MAFFSRVAGAALHTLAPPQVGLDAIEADLRGELEAHGTPEGVVLPAATWLLTARAP